MTLAVSLPGCRRSSGWQVCLEWLRNPGTAVGPGNEESVAYEGCLGSYRYRVVGVVAEVGDDQRRIEQPVGGDVGDLEVGWRHRGDRADTDGPCHISDSRCGRCPRVPGHIQPSGIAGSTECRQE